MILLKKSYSGQADALVRNPCSGQADALVRYPFALLSSADDGVRLDIVDLGKAFLVDLDLT